MLESGAFIKNFAVEAVRADKVKGTLDVLFSRIEFRRSRRELIKLL